MNGNSIKGWKQERRVAKLWIVLSVLLNPLVFGQSVTMMLSKPRSALAATAVGNLVIFAGGNECNDPTACASSTVDIYNVTSRIWSTATLSKRRYYLCATTVGNLAMFAGGADFPPHIFPDVDIYDAASDSWSTTTLTEPRASCQAASVGTRALFAGGNLPDSYSDRVDIFDSTTKVWESSRRLSVARGGLAATAVGDLVLFAGGQTSPDIPSNVVEIFNSTSNGWAIATLSIARWNLTATAVGDVALFAGGTNTTDGSYVFNQVDIYHSSNDTWTTATLSTSMSLLASGSIGNFAYFAGPSTVVDIYNVLTNVWTTTQLASPRQLLAAASTGEKLFFGGGRMTSSGEISAIVEVFDLCGNCIDDGIFCNGKEYCDVVGICISPGNPCSSGSPCNNTCNESARNCLTPNRTNCDDSIFCNGADYCDGEGQCIHTGDPCQGGYCNAICNEQPAYCIGMECAAESDVNIVNINITLNGDTKNCTLCGRNDYACSTDDSWQPKQQFNDPSNEGYVVNRVTVTAVDLKWCNSSVKIYLQDLLVGATLPNLLCACDACPQSTTFTAQIDPSWSGYNYAGINTITIDGGGSEVCLGTLLISLTFTSSTSIEILTNEYVPESFDTPMDSETSEDSSILIIILVFVLAFVSLIVIVILFVFHKKILHRNDNISLADSDKSIYLTDITIHESLGGGNFGEVFRGTWHGSTVALKLFKSETDYIDNEIQLLKKLNHSNIVRYFGIHVSSEMVSYIVMEFMQYGNLNMFLQSKKDSNELKNSILIDMTLQAAAGMMYLEEQKIIHRDLAARNLLAAKGDERHYVTVKVADFGLSREVERGYYKSDTRIMPYKWCPPESIQYGTFTTKSDVWAFGVSMWEIFSYGQLPYQSMSNNEATEFVLKGNRLKIPDACPQQVYDMMMQCWMSEPEKRPSFQSLEELLKQFRMSEAQLEPVKDSTAFYNE